MIYSIDHEKEIFEDQATTESISEDSDQYASIQSWHKSTYLDEDTNNQRNLRFKPK